jgi:apolipoprotein N-acyltransferase
MHAPSERATAYPPPWRVVAAVLVAVSRGSLLVLAPATFLVQPPIGPRRLIQLFAALVVAPAVAAWAVQRLFAVTVRIESGALVVLQGRRPVADVPARAIETVSPWRIPLPAPGLRVDLPSARAHALSLADPGALAERLADAGAGDRVRRAARHPALVWARARRAARRRWDHPLLKFVAFALVPALPLFRLHQHLAYGGTFGEYYVYGLRPYLFGLGLYWALFAIYLVLYAAVLRAATEVVAVAAAVVAPTHAAWVRRAAEAGHRLLYYGGVPAVLILRLWPW